MAYKDDVKKAGQRVGKSGKGAAKGYKKTADPYKNMGPMVAFCAELIFGVLRILFYSLAPVLRFIRRSIGRLFR